jgi:preprotein translocase subunit SecA
MTQSLTRYHALFGSIASRSRRTPALRGIDRGVSTLQMRLRTARITPNYLRSQAEQVDHLAPRLRELGESALDAEVLQTRELFQRSRHQPADVLRALALIREVARRTTGQEAYIVQLMAALGLYHGHILEMRTGEGKTLTGSIAAPLLAWAKRRVHVFTVNDYLARRDAESRAPIYARCGLECGSIYQELDGHARARVYAMPIVYGTPKQITADFLRDQLRLGNVRTAWAGRARFSAGPEDFNTTGAGPMIPGLHAALVDEADAVLIDEGVTPLIIAQSRTGDEMGPIYVQAAKVAGELEANTDYTVNQLQRKVELTKRGLTRALALIETLPEPIWKARRRALELVRQALIARHCYLRDRQYMIRDGTIVIVDEYTGRILADRHWEHGLHQAVEAKEGLDVTADRETLARLSFQRFFRMYPFLCGMTGTAADATGEMEQTYQRKVTVIPTNRPIAREQWPTRVFRTSEARWNAVVESIVTLHKQGRPVLAGTRSVEASELLSRKLAARGLAHKVLNANFDAEEASMIAGAGHAGAITVATNMAGRGTDIILDRRAREAGGLHVILSEMHGAERIDRQFIGRAGRQGDPGSAQFLLSLDDELVKLNTRRGAIFLKGARSAEEFLGNRLRLAVALFKLAQRRSEARDRTSRSAVLKQDDWIDKHLPGSD